jgi:hypothetical protein
MSLINTNAYNDLRAVRPHSNYLSTTTRHAQLAQS